MSSMPRIPTLFAYERSLEAMNERRASMQDIQHSLSTGRRVNAPSDDPVGAAQAERIRSRLARMEREARMTGFAMHMLAGAETAMGAGVEIVQQVREALVQAGDGALSASDRRTIAAQLRQAREGLLGIANAGDGSGGFVFGGQGSSGEPFRIDGTPATPPQAGVQRTGHDGAFTTTQDGRAIFVDLRAEYRDPAAPGTVTQRSASIFQTLDEAIALLEQDPRPADAEYRVRLDNAFAGVDAGMEALLLARTRAGEQMRAIEARQRLIESGEIEATGQLSDLRDLDYAAAITALSADQTALEAAMLSYARIARLSLFDRL